MYKNKTFMCLIAARGGSKRLPGKNLMQFAGKSLFAHTAHAAVHSKIFDYIITSTDSDDIGTESSQRCGIEVPFSRPPELATDTADVRDVVRHACEWVEESEWHMRTDYLVLLSPTNPLRTAEDIADAAGFLVDNDYDSLASISPSHPQEHLIVRTETCKGDAFIYDIPDEKALLRENATPAYALNGGIYIAKWEIWAKRKPLFGDKYGFYILPRGHEAEIDDIYDFVAAEAISIWESKNGKSVSRNMEGVL